MPQNRPQNLSRMKSSHYCEIKTLQSSSQKTNLVNGSRRTIRLTQNEYLPWLLPRLNLSQHLCSATSWKIPQTKARRSIDVGLRAVFLVLEFQEKTLVLELFENAECKFSNLFFNSEAQTTPKPR